MIVKRAKSLGFCFGVKKAIKQAEKTKDASTIGPLIHNNEEITRLQRDFNVKTIEGINELTNEKKAIIRTHGITKSDLKSLETKGIEIIDATCPFVKKPQEIVEKMSSEGYEIVIFGDANHPEVKGIKSYSSTNAYVVLEEKELADIKFKGKVAVVSQTTKKVENFMKIVNFLMLKVKEVRVFNTICDATFKNQEAIKSLSLTSDVMIIVGGKNSSNTKQLFLIAQNNCKDSYHVENEEELQKEWFIGKNICGISAGASTPEWIIKKVEDKILSFDENYKKE